MFIVTLFIFILIFGLIVFVHELGHFLVAKRADIYVEEFAFGFPPRLFAKKVGETVYAINAIPLGGYVRMRGEDGVSTDPRAFSQKSAGARALVVIAGVAMNLLLAWILLTIILVLPARLKATDAIFVVQVEANSAAENAHFLTGDIIERMDATVIHTSQNLRDFTTGHRGQAVTVMFRRSGREQTRQVTLGSGDAPFGIATTSFSLAQVPNPPLWKAPGVALVQIASVAGANFHFIGSLILGLLGIGAHVSADSVSGPVGIYGLIAQFTALGWVYVLAAMAQLSLAVALFNILPIPALDGGRLLFIILQKLFRRLKISEATEGTAHTIGFIALMGLFVIVTWNDIVKLIRR